ncbi:MAG: hypothetical protein RLZZ127_423 [Planctomycetota bacterium]|jgi:hypothetical protein
MSALFLLLVAVALTALPAAPWPLSIGIWNGAPAAAALGIAAVLTLDRMVHAVSGPPRALLAAALVLMPVVPVVSPWSPLHTAAWIGAVVCGGLGLAMLGRRTAWILAAMAWTVWWLGPESVGRHGQAVVLAGLAAAAAATGPATPPRYPSISNTASSG